MKKITTKLGLISTLIILSTSFAQAAIVANISGANGPSVMEFAGNGSDVVRINGANSRGVSFNQYDEFNVGAKGVIFANNTSDVTLSDGQNVAGNTRLNGRTASVIVNEVVGSGTSTLSGKIEVAGDKADLVIANPNGLTCDGCSVKNVNTLSLVAGKVFNNDYHSRVETVDGATLTINGAGLDAAGVNRTQLVGHNIRIDSKLLAGNELSIIAGKVSHNTFVGGYAQTRSAKSDTLDNGNIVISANGDIIANNVISISVVTNSNQALLNNGKLSTNAFYNRISKVK